MGGTIPGQDQFADGVVDATLQQLRNQEDARGEISVHGFYILNPQLFQFDIQDRYTVNDPLPRPPTTAQQKDKRTAVIGPITFQYRFQGAPDISFGQAPQPPFKPTPTAVAVTDSPFLVQPYVHSWVWINGQVDGFYLGLYALTKPPTNANLHTVSWNVSGRSSRYQQQAVDQTWSDSSYDNNEADFLSQDVTNQGAETEVAYEDVIFDE